MVEDVQ